MGHEALSYTFLLLQAVVGISILWYPTAPQEKPHESHHLMGLLVKCSGHPPGFSVYLFINSVLHPNIEYPSVPGDTLVNEKDKPGSSSWEVHIIMENFPKWRGSRKTPHSLLWTSKRERYQIPDVVGILYLLLMSCLFTGLQMIIHVLLCRNTHEYMSWAGTSPLPVSDLGQTGLVKKQQSFSPAGGVLESSKLKETHGSELISLSQARL